MRPASLPATGCCSAEQKADRRRAWSRQPIRSGFSFRAPPGKEPQVYEVHSCRTRTSLGSPIPNANEIRDERNELIGRRWTNVQLERLQKRPGLHPWTPCPGATTQTREKHNQHDGGHSG